ncbi:hypothetical protein DL96DRAFT_1615871 [Flagelloscypha sp. PMI_526]|nr:hypothetical protein DL96DRAFT_1615871 [Flagelloscypha sp. PMI_526]
MAAQTSGTWYSIADGSQSLQPATSRSAYVPFHTTFAAGVGTDGATTYIVSEVITRVDVFDSSGRTEATYTEPQTLVGTFVVGKSYQAGTFPITQTASPTQTGTPQIAYNCSYNVPAGLGDCVNEGKSALLLIFSGLRGYDTTQQVTVHGSMVPAATFTPYTLLHQIAIPYHPHAGEPQAAHRSNTPGIVGGVVGGVVGLLALLFAFYIFYRRRAARRHATQKRKDVTPFSTGLFSRRTSANSFEHDIEIKSVDAAFSYERSNPHSSEPPLSSGKQSLFKEGRTKAEKSGFNRASTGSQMAMQHPPAYQESVFYLRDE